MLNMLIYQLAGEIEEGREELDKIMMDLSSNFDDVQEKGLHTFLMQQKANLYEPLVRLYLKEKQLKELKANCTEQYLQTLLIGESIY
ncbi:hypothetical protein [Paenibacillus odorifer]|uniref:hypothetical protein n=1 Tax=Paenibacillus odorifer TaxID=189426 RepID=UPI00096E2380|nr:hypothetical protein [Paenibacillus odorifer]OMD08210.1 hypothetical protein BJP47_30110 [Paenibacillus odorifer]